MHVKGKYIFPQLCRVWHTFHPNLLRGMPNTYVHKEWQGNLSNRLPHFKVTFRFGVIYKLLLLPTFLGAILPDTSNRHYIRGRKAFPLRFYAFIASENGIFPGRSILLFTFS